MDERGIHHLTEGPWPLDNHTVVRRLLFEFDRDPLSNHYDKFEGLREALKEGVYLFLKDDRPVTRGLLWKVRDLFDDTQSTINDARGKDHDMDERFTRMRQCIDRELSVLAVPSPTVREIWKNRLHACIGFVRSGVRTVLGGSA